MDPVILSSLLAVAGAVIIGVVIVSAYVGANRHLPEEKGLTARFESRCTFAVGRFVMTGTNFPYGRIALYDTFMVLTGMSIGGMVIPYQSIDDVRRTLLGAIKIHVRQKDRERLIQISCRDNRKAHDLLSASTNTSAANDGTATPNSA
jgi:hypothetical protein